MMMILSLRDEQNFTSSGRGKGVNKIDERKRKRWKDRYYSV